MSQSPCSIKDLSVSYQNQNDKALDDINIDFRAGEMSAIVGPNGAGKSTLLKAALGLVPHQSGEVHFFGQKLNDVRRKIAYVPQRASVDWDFPIRVQEVVQQGLFQELKLTNFFTPPRHKELAMEALEQVGLEQFADRQISKLSGGQQQRMFLARALVQAMMEDGAELFILDEPFAGVDAATEKVIIDILQDLAEDGKTIIAVHHNLATVPEYFDEVALINQKLIAYGPIKQAFSDQNIQRTYIPFPNAGLEPA